MKDSAFAEPLWLYQERYTDYFRVHCDVELAESQSEKQAVEPMRLLQPLLKKQLAEARQEILSMAYRPEKVWREVEIRKPTGRHRTAACVGRHRDCPDSRQGRDGQAHAKVTEPATCGSLLTSQEGGGE